MSYYAGTFLVGVNWIGFPFQKLQLFSGIFLGSTYWPQSIWKKDTRNFCLFVYLQSYNDKSKFSFIQTVQSSRNLSYLWTSHLCAKCLYRFLALIFLYTLKKVPLKKDVRLWKWKLNHTPQLAQKNCFRKDQILNFALYSKWFHSPAPSAQ